MMIALLLALAAPEPRALEASGMEPQLRVVREEAAKRKWPILCEGLYGDQGTVKVAVPSDASEAERASFWEVMASVASSYGDSVELTCEKVTLPVDDSVDLRTLFLTTTDHSDRLLKVARECGFTKAFWRPARPEELAPFEGHVPNLKKYSIALDAGENALARYGPLSCFEVLGLEGNRRSPESPSK